MNAVLQPIDTTPGFAPWSGSPALGPAPGLDAAAARRYCAARAAGHYENFPVLAAPFSRAQREALAAVYAFARTADDFADEPAFEGRRERLLDGWELELRRCFAGEAEHPVFVALRESIPRFGYEARPFLDLLSAFRQDARVRRYATFDEVLDYCRRSANPVGRLVLRTLGVDDPRRGAWSDRLCTALQLANFWQDLSVDLPRDRLYVPLADLARYEVPLEAVLARRVVPGVAEVLRLQLDRTAALFADAVPLVASIGWPGRAYLAAVWLGGRTVLALTRALGTDVLRHRPALGAREGLCWAGRMLRRRRGGAPS
ncbi:MAG: squalene synthase HpnC [Deltaproteobacteria bacterium]|nr:squalene synthase HpnC [Deltaproteobacteria bacterium]